MRREAGGRAGFLRIGAGLSLGRMSDSGKSVQRAVRRRRLSVALRENLKRRKAQAKAQLRAKAPAKTGVETPGAAESAGEPAAEPHDSAGIGADKRGGSLPFTSRQAEES